MYFITVSEMLGTNGEKIAREVAKRMGYAFYGRDELFKAADEMGVLQGIEGVELKSPTLLEKILSDVPKIYLGRFQSVIFEAAKKGNGVFFGKGSQFLLSSFDCALHVLVVGSMEKRIHRVMEEDHVTREVAEKMISTSDHDKRAFVRYAFDEDWLNLQLYHLVLNTDTLTIDSAVKIIAEAATLQEIKECGAEAIQTLSKLALQRKIESTLLEAGVMSPHLFFELEGTDSVRLFGSVNSFTEKEEIVKILKEIKEIKHFRNDLTALTMR